MAINPAAEDESDLDTYPLPDSSDINDPYLQEVWDDAVDELEEDDEDDDEDYEDDDDEDDEDEGDDEADEPTQYDEEFESKHPRGDSGQFLSKHERQSMAVDIGFWVGTGRANLEAEQKLLKLMKVDSMAELPRAIKNAPDNLLKKAHRLIAQDEAEQSNRQHNEQFASIVDSLQGIVDGYNSTDPGYGHIFYNPNTNEAYGVTADGDNSRDARNFLKAIRRLGVRAQVDAEYAPRECYLGPPWVKIAKSSQHGEESRKTYSTGIVETDVYGAKAYHAKCLVPGCNWQTKRYDRIHHAQAAAKKHGEEHAQQDAQHSEEPANPEPSKFSSTQFNLPGDLAFEVRMLGDLIDFHDLAEDGRELNPHVTALYGLHADDPSEVVAAVTPLAPIAIQLGPVSVFAADTNKPTEPGNHDVLKIEVQSEGLHALHKALKQLPHTSTYPDYKPHITIAYVKPGMGEYYAKRLNLLEGRVAVFDRLVFSNKLREHTPIRLTGKAQFQEEEAPSAPFWSSIPRD